MDHRKFALALKDFKGRMIVFLFCDALTDRCTKMEILIGNFAEIISNDYLPLS